MEKQSLPKAIIFSLLVILASAAVQCLVMYAFEFFSKLTVLIPIAGAFFAYSLILKFYPKHLIINAVWVIILTYVLNVFGGILGEAVIIANSIESIDMLGALTQIYCALFSPENVSEIFDAAEFIAAIKSDLTSILTMNLIGIVIAVVFMIINIVKANKANKMAAEYQFQNQSNVNQNSYTTIASLTEPTSFNAKKETNFNISNCKEIVEIFADKIKNYKQSKDKDQFNEDLSDFNNVITSLTSTQQEMLLSYAKDSVNSEDMFIKKACEYILKKLSN